MPVSVLDIDEHMVPTLLVAPAPVAWVAAAYGVVVVDVAAAVDAHVVVAHVVVASAAGTDVVVID
eukprot:8695396-Prorocentrum_lima.AAC.1